MPRYRKLHTKLCESYDFSEMPDDFTRLLWVMLPLQMSREGTIPADAVLIHSKVFPLRRDVTCDQIDDALAWYAERDMIRFYEVGGRRYIWAVNFAKYQGSTTKESESDYPSPPEQWPQDTASTPDQLPTNSRPTPDQVERKSSTDAVCNMQYSDVDVDAVCIPDDGDGDESGANAPEKPTAQVADDEGAGKVYEAWGMARGGLVNAMDAEQLGDMIDEYSPEWVLEAIHEANSSRNGRIITLRFPQVILERWKQEGFKAPRDRGSPDAAAADLAHKRQMAEQTRVELRKEGIPEDRIEAAIKAKLGGGV